MTPDPSPKIIIKTCSFNTKVIIFFLALSGTFAYRLVAGCALLPDINDS
jgi:hypothetical protein